MNKTVVTVFLFALLSGCAAQTYHINSGDAGQPHSQHSQHFFVAGIGQEKSTNAADVCGGVDNIIKVESQQTFVNGLLGFVTFGIYTPRDAKVYCKS